MGAGELYWRSAEDQVLNEVLLNDINENSHSGAPKYILSMKLLFLLAIGASAFAPTAVIVTGATGKVGRLIIQSLLKSPTPPTVIAIARNESKARSLFAPDDNLNWVIGDLADDPGGQSGVITRAFSKCDLTADSLAVVAVHGTFRLTKLLDILPHRVLRKLIRPLSPPAPSDLAHPYYNNYNTIKAIIKHAEAHSGVGRIVRLTGLSTGFSPFNPVAILFNLLLSQSAKYHALAEKALKASPIATTILRPGGLSDEPREEGQGLEVSTFTDIPPPARVTRVDVASLAVFAATRCSKNRRDETIAIRNAPLAEGSCADAEGAFAVVEEQLTGKNEQTKYWSPRSYDLVSRRRRTRYSILQQGRS